MHVLISDIQQHTVYPTVYAAQAVIDKMTAIDPGLDGWRYEVETDPKGSGRATIRVYDEDGLPVGRL